MRFAERTVLSDISLNVGASDRIAVVGDNAAGKSTLLGVLAGTVTLTAGDVEVALPGGLALAEQRPTFTAGATVAQAIDDLLRDLREMEADIAAVSERLASAHPDTHPRLLAQLAAAIDRFDARGGYEVERRLDSALDQLSLGGLDRERPVHSLSGGERARLALAAAMSSGAELLLLDEPTNDLDDAGITWLEGRLAQHRGALVVVTHDRAFLERFATDIVSVAQGELRRTGNGYSGYLAARETERRQLAAAHAAWAHELTRNETLVSANAFRLEAIPRKQEKSGFGHGAFRARNRDHGAMSRIRQAKQQLERLQADPAPRPLEPLRFAPGFTAVNQSAAPRASTAPAATGPTTSEPAPPGIIEPGTGSSAPILIRATGVRLGIDGEGPRLQLPNMELRAGERWLISGSNGAGKTTLLRAIAGEIAPSQGDVKRSSGLRIAWLRQELAAAGELTLRETFASETGGHLDDASDRLLGLGLFPPEDLDRRVDTLSIGQRRRLELALAVTDSCDLLLLDEPTNHLAPELVEELELALLDFPGLVLTVTHDRRWRERAATAGPVRRILVEAGGKVEVLREP